MNEFERLEADAKQAMKNPSFGMLANPAVVLALIERVRKAESKTDELTAVLIDAELIMRVLEGKKSISPTNSYPLRRAWRAAVKALDGKTL